jgi:hypothetical protein
MPALDGGRDVRTQLKTVLRRAIPALAIFTFAPAALADAIDGNWCHQDGRRFSIRGPEIVTPKGAHLQGNYSRHYFSYVAPASEPSGGETISMTLVNEFTVHLQAGSAAPVEEWKRCSPDISRRSPLPGAGVAPVA